MISLIKKQLFFDVIFFLILGLFFTTKIHAATLQNTSDTISTSRPSASAPISADIAAGVGQVTVVDIPGSSTTLFLASDSATFLPQNLETLNSVNVASTSGSAANLKTIYFTNTVGAAHHIGTTLVTPVTATHKIQFTTSGTISASGKILITFPGTAVTTASPSASTFSFNGLTSANAAANISYKLDGTRTCTFTVATSGNTPTITCTMDGGGSLAGGSTVTFLIGCSDASSNETSCTTVSPRLINPTKTNTTAGTADTWKIAIKTQDSSSNDQDQGSAVIATVEAVQVQGTVDAFMTFTITGINTGQTVCTDTTNSGINATATFVNLGDLNTGINIAAQSLKVSSNGAGGYVITATSSGKFINKASGFFLPDANVGNSANFNALSANDTPAAAAITAGTPAFGIHPCRVAGTYPPTVTGWGASNGTAGGSGNLYSNPWNISPNSFYASLSSYSGPSDSTSETDVEYAATVKATTPAGIYSNYFTYIATPSF